MILLFFLVLRIEIVNFVVDAVTTAYVLMVLQLVMIMTYFPQSITNLDSILFQIIFGLAIKSDMIIITNHANYDDMLVMPHFL